jgi:hypothetical protein
MTTWWPVEFLPLNSVRPRAQSASLRWVEQAEIVRPINLPRMAQLSCPGPETSAIDVNPTAARTCSSNKNLSGAWERKTLAHTVLGKLDRAVRERGRERRSDDRVSLLPRVATTKRRSYNEWARRGAGCGAAPSSACSLERAHAAPPRLP